MKKLGYDAIRAQINVLVWNKIAVYIPSQTQKLILARVSTSSFECRHIIKRELRVIKKLLDKKIDFVLC